MANERSPTKGMNFDLTSFLHRTFEIAAWRGGAFRIQYFFHIEGLGQSYLLLYALIGGRPIHIY